MRNRSPLPLLALVLGASLARPVGAGGLGVCAIAQNDSFVSPQVAAFQAGFVADEIGASRLISPDTFLSRLYGVEFLFGGLGGDRTVTLHIWDDAAGAAMPGLSLFAGDYLVTANNDSLQYIDLFAEEINVSGPIRVGIEFHHDGLPSIARDNDGIAADRNFIFVPGQGWFDSIHFGLSGDWIIRAVVCSPPSDVEDTPLPPTSSLRAHPNPFNPHTTLRFELAAASVVRLELFAVDGRRVRTLLSAPLAAGPHFKVWDGRDDRGNAVASGSYVARLQAGPAVRTFHMTLAR
jgi:hypothetical protein